MALKTKTAPVGDTGLVFKKRGKDDLKKVMIYGNDGTGKSTFAETYCRTNGLSPICIDIDDTNYTNVPIVDIDLSSDLNTYRYIKDTILKIKQTEEFDTIIIDGVTSLLEGLVSKAKGMKKYSDRAERFGDILRLLQSSGKHLIFIGQADMEVIFTEEYQSNKMVIKINSIVNEKYHCIKTPKGSFKVETIKYRTAEDNPEKEEETVSTQ